MDNKHTVYFVFNNYLPLGMMRLLPACISLLIVWPQFLHAQWKEKKLIWQGDSLCLDSADVFPGSIHVWSNGKDISSSFSSRGISGCIKKNKEANIPADTLCFRWRRMPVSYSAKKFRKDERWLQIPDYFYRNPYKVEDSKQNPDYFATEGLNKTGSLSRGITFGNNQDLVVNSNLNLQLNGRLSEQVQIQAAISDNNVPIQPEGNTQQLQEFDRVYISLFNDNNRLTVGDFQLLRPSGYFMNYNKRGQGLSFSGTYQVPLKDSLRLRTQVSAAVSRGKFSRNVILGIERNQGPYRLRGAENEVFIIILANTERVYIDGELLRRGQDHDYVINYNTAEITFTAKRIITKDKRIIAEFQYSDRNYARSLTQFSQEFAYREQVFRINYYNEQDNRNKPVFQPLNAYQKEVLRQAGDSLSLAVVPAIDTTSFSATEVLYLSKDTVVNGIEYKNIFAYSVNPEKAFYRVGFSPVGSNRGNYVQIPSAANGKVFAWIAPVNGIPQGNFAPIAQLIPPRRKQMLTLATENKIGKSTQTRVEFVSTENNRNTFSEKDKEDDRGMGLRASMAGKYAVRADSSLFVNTRLEYEGVSRSFVYVERYRDVEFERDWNRNLSTDDIRGTQHLLSLQTGLETKKISLLYTFSHFDERNFFSGSRHQADLLYRDEKNKISARASQLTSNEAGARGSFLRYRAFAERMLGKKFRAGANVDNDDSRIKPSGTELLQARSFWFRETGAFAGTRDTVSRLLLFKYMNRVDYGPSGENMKLATHANNYQLDAGFANGGIFTFRSTLVYRSLQISDSLLSPQKKPEETILGRIENSLKLWKGVLTTNQFYETGSGLEVRKEFSYLEVPAGTGIYTWKDYNSNGIRELNEFELAVYRDQANFIRVFTPTNSFVRTYDNQFNQTITLNLAALPKKRSGNLQQFLRSWYNQFAYRVERKFTGNPGNANIFNPLRRNFTDTNLVNLRASVKNTLSYNRNNPLYGADYFIQQNLSNSLLVNGLEQRTNDFSGGRARLTLFKSFTLSGEYTRGKKIYTNLFFTERNYFITYNEIKPEIAFQPGVAYKISLQGLLRFKQNNKPESAGETLRQQQLALDFRYNTPSAGSFQCRVQGIQMQFVGDVNSPIGFEMLESLLPGTNYVWSISWQRTLGNNIQFNLSYDGRKSPSSPTVHIGGVQLRTYF